MSREIKIKEHGNYTGANESLFDLDCDNLDVDTILTDSKGNRFRICRYLLKYAGWSRIKYLDGKPPCSDILFIEERKE